MRLAIARFMTDSVTSASGAGTGQAQPAAPGLAELFISFVKVALSGFGAALPWARRMIVEQKRWMNTQEFNEAFAVAQFLPGPNVVNFSVVFGARFGGVAGAAAAFFGLMLPPLVIVMVLAMLYARYGDLSALGRILSGVTCAAVGLLLATVAKMAAPLVSRRLDWAPLIAIVAFVGVAILRWPLPYVFLGLAPVSIALAFLRS